MATLPSPGEAQRYDDAPPEIKPRFLEPTFGRAAKIWWAWLWRSIIFGGAAGLFGSLVLSISGVSERISQRAAQTLGMAVGVALAIPVGIWVFQMILEKNFGEFRLRLMRNVPPSSASSFDESAAGRSER